MKKLFCILAALSVLMGAAWADGDPFGEVLWTEYPGHYFHYYENCTVLEQELTYPIVQGSQDQAVAAGRNTACLICCARKFNGAGADAATLGQYLLSSMSDDDLAYFSTMCSSELARRQPQPLTLYPGVYYVGQDIPAGAYRMELVNGQNVYAAVYKSQQEYSSDFRIPLFDKMFIAYTGETIAGRVQLDFDNVLLLQGTFALTPFVGVNP